MRLIQEKVDAINEKVARFTRDFVQTKLGQAFLGAVLLGPLTFIPTVWAAWTEPNINPLRTLTWPLMIVINISGGLNVVHKGDWRMRLVTFIWILMMVAVFIATIIPDHWRFIPIK